MTTRAPEDSSDPDAAIDPERPTWERVLWVAGGLGFVAIGAVIRTLLYGAPREGNEIPERGSRARITQQLGRGSFSAASNANVAATYPFFSRVILCFYVEIHKIDALFAPL